MITLFVFQFNSCDIFESTTISSKEIKKASSWSKKDQAPTYPECDSLDKKEQLECFQNIVKELLMMSISESNLVATNPLEENIVLTLKIDKKGVFSLLETEIPNRVLDLLPLLESTQMQLPIYLRHFLQPKLMWESMLILNSNYRSKSVPSLLNE